MVHHLGFGPTLSNVVRRRINPLGVFVEEQSGRNLEAVDEGAQRTVVLTRLVALEDDPAQARLQDNFRLGVLLSVLIRDHIPSSRSTPLTTS